MNETDNYMTPNESEEPSEEEAKKIEEITPAAPVPENRTRSILRNVLRWTLTLLITFGLGALTMYLVLFLPTNRELEQATIDLKQSTQEIDTLENQIKVLEHDNQELKSELDSAELRLVFLSAISDVRAANLAAAEDDFAGALLSIKDASQTLTELKNALGSDQNEVITTMQDNLNAIEQSLKSDPQAAQSGLERLSTNLMKLENAILK